MAKAEQLRAEDLKAWEQQDGDAERGEGDEALSPLPPALQTRVAALGLKEGEKLRISLGHAMEGKERAGAAGSHRHTPTLSASSPGVATDGLAPLLPPPPGDRSPAVGSVGETGREERRQQGQEGKEGGGRVGGLCRLR